MILAETERLILRRYKKEDIQDLFEYLSDPEVVKYEPYKPMTLEEAKENLERLLFNRHFPMACIGYTRSVTPRM